MARIKDKKEKALELEARRQEAILIAKRASIYKNDGESKYEEAPVLSDINSTKVKRCSLARYDCGIQTSEPEIAQAKHSSAALSQVNQSLCVSPQSSQERQLTVAKHSHEATNEFGCLPGQVADNVEELSSKVSIVNKETNTSLHLLKDIAHLIPCRSGLPPETTIDKERLCAPDSVPVPTTPPETMPLEDNLLRNEFLVDSEEVVEELFLESIEDRDYLEAVEEVQIAISQELLESAVKMSPQISEAIVGKVAALGPEGLEVLEEIKSKISTRLLSSSKVSQESLCLRSPTLVCEPVTSGPAEIVHSQPLMLEQDAPVSPSSEDGIPNDSTLLSSEDMDIEEDTEGMLKSVSITKD